ncbi:hypothetical protein T552_03325 [Pneumocystis carinii B80]|uniref:Uncharacterized protein n=1 Tax=Pneumocystis carinii (strain B80) TaxID=1408658 RepID=A0A0W4ZBS8_PNEC8|nr:hypothetical protein T552_03325 [Pneumocystis carinii B80]KTW25713.1 hypothetical protein T552_03325 [Pneumocystis carinii B80]
MSCVETFLGHPRSYYDPKMISNSISDDIPFSSQFDDVEKAIENLVKCGKLFFWKNSLHSTTHSCSEYNYRSSYPLIGRQTGIYELEHMHSQPVANPLSYHTNQHYYNQRIISHTEQFPLSRRKNKSNSECCIYTALERSGSEQLPFSRERAKTSLIKNVTPTVNNDIMSSRFSETPRVLPDYIYEELDLKNSSISTLFLPRESSSNIYPFTCFQEYSTNLNTAVDGQTANNVIDIGDSVNKNLPFFYKKKNIMENNEASSLVSANKVKNILAPIGTKSSDVLLSVDPLNQQVQDTSTFVKPLQYYFPDGKVLKNDMYNGVFFKKYMGSGKSVHWNGQIWNDDANNLGITSNNNGFGLDVLC